MANKWKVLAEHEGKRLDHFVVEQLPEFSRTSVQAAIVAGDITVNDSKATKHHFLKEGDIVKSVAKNPADKKQAAWWKSVPEVPVPILFEDDSIVVINKPVGVVMHSVDERDTQPSIAAWFVKKMGGVKKLADVGDGVLRPGIVHRLDKHVGGVVVLAKTSEAYEALKVQFQNRTVNKEYRAIIYGVPPQESGDIRFALGRSKTHGGKMAARPEHEEGRDAWTEYDVLQDVNGRYSYVKIQIHTGRTHQIRAHFAAIDHPIVGDHMYNSKKYPLYQKSKNLFLHAYDLRFDHPVTSERLDFTAPLPTWFGEFGIKE